MEFKEEIEDLRAFYKSRIKESQEILDENFSDVVDVLEDFIKDYRQHIKYCDSYKNLMNKVEKVNLIKSSNNLKSFLGGFNKNEEAVNE